MPENQKAEKLVGARRGRPPKADKAVPGKSKASTKVRAFHFIHADHSWETVEKFPLLLT